MPSTPRGRSMIAESDDDAVVTKDLTGVVTSWNAAAERYRPGRDDGHVCVIVNGPAVPVGGNAVTQVALVLHELATNAVKHGALSVPDGCVQIDWSVEKGGLYLQWEERGGPPLTGPPAHRGFGGSMILGIVTYQFGGQISQEWKTEGLIVRLFLAVERLAA